MWVKRVQSHANCLLKSPQGYLRSSSGMIKPDTITFIGSYLRAVKVHSTPCQRGVFDITP